MREIEIKVKGMVCGGCENRVKNALSSIEGVEKVEADYHTGVVTVVASETVEREVLEEKIDDIGFEVVKED